MIVDIKACVYEMILSAIGDGEYDNEALTAGINSYIFDNGFLDLDDTFSDTVIKKVISNNLESILADAPADIVLFFANYDIIKKIRMLDNKALKYASDVSKNNELDNEKVNELEGQLEKYIEEIKGKPELYNMLKRQISEIVLNLDYSKKISPYMSQRLRNIGVRT